MPVPVAVAIAAAWVVAIAAQATGLASYVHHDALLVGGPPLGLALIAFLLAWQVMIAAMMLPSSLPLVRLFAAASQRQPRSGTRVAAFLGGYALVWSVFGAVALAFDLGVHTAVNSIGWLHERDWLIAASVLAMAGAFEFTGLKDACLRNCRLPEQFMLRHYRRGTGAAALLGIRHGAFCIGCCWALMLVMFAAGVASLMWMALLTVVMVHEKTHPAGRDAVPVTGATLMVLAVVVLAASGIQAGAI